MTPKVNETFRLYSQKGNKSFTSPVSEPNNDVRVVGKFIKYRAEHPNLTSKEMLNQINMSPLERSELKKGNLEAIER